MREDKAKLEEFEAKATLERKNTRANIQKLREELERAKERERELREQLDGTTPNHIEDATQYQLSDWYRSLQATQILLQNTGNTFIEAARVLSGLDNLVPLRNDEKGICVTLRLPNNNNSPNRIRIEVQNNQLRPRRIRYRRASGYPTPGGLLDTVRFLMMIFKNTFIRLSILSTLVVWGELCHWIGTPHKSSCIFGTKHWQPNQSELGQCLEESDPLQGR